MTVEVHLNGIGPLHFVVDTGADRTVIADDVAARLGRETERPVMVEGIVRTIPAVTMHVQSLEVGPVMAENIRLPILPRSLLGADGYLGLDMLIGKNARFDFANNVIEIMTPRAQFYSDDHGRGLFRVPARGAFGHLKALDCNIDDISATAFIDSGGQVTIANSKLGNALLADSANHKPAGSLTVTGVTGGSVDAQVVTIQTVRMKGLHFQTPLIAIADLQIFDAWGLSDVPALLIGMNYLRAFANVEIDYSADEFRFQLAQYDIALGGGAVG